MVKTLSLKEDIESFMKMKLSICKCDPCTCSQKTKGLYFEELKEVLTKHNKDYVADMLIQLSSSNNRNNRSMVNR